MPNIPSAKEFIRVYMEAYRTGNAISWVAAKLGVTPKSASGQAGRLRRSGVDLPYLSRTPKRSEDEVTNLNNLVRNLKDAQ